MSFYKINSKFVFVFLTTYFKMFIQDVQDLLDEMRKQLDDVKKQSDEMRKLKAIIVKHENRIRALEATLKAREDDVLDAALSVSSVSATPVQQPPGPEHRPDAAAPAASQLAPDEV